MLEPPRRQIVPPEVEAEWAAQLDEYESNLVREGQKFFEQQAQSGPPDKFKGVAGGFVTGEHSPFSHRHERGEQNAPAHVAGSPFAAGGTYAGQPTAWHKGHPKPSPAPALPTSDKRKQKR